MHQNVSDTAIYVPSYMPRCMCRPTGVLDWAAQELRKVAPRTHSRMFPRSFGGISPEKKAANGLRTLFTFVAVK
jgi:hypothetical protein